MEYQRPAPLEPDEEGWLTLESEAVEEGFAAKFLWRDARGATEEVLVARRDGRVFAADSLCPHQGGRLMEGPLMGGEHLHCPLHLYRFEPDSGEAVEVLCRPLTVYPARESEGRIRVRVAGPGGGERGADPGRTAGG